MAIQKLSATGQDHGPTERLNGGDAAGAGDYALMMADRRVEDASRRVAEQIRVVAEIEAAGEPSDRATESLQELEQELKLLTERREAARLEASSGSAEEREAG